MLILQKSKVTSQSRALTHIPPPLSFAATALQRRREQEADKRKQIKVIIPRGLVARNSGGLQSCQQQRCWACNGRCRFPQELVFESLEGWDPHSQPSQSVKV
jgi:hypothetical protein